MFYFLQKFKAAVKPSNNWGPKDPISRLNWIQWSTKAQQGEKDFTLKRKGTRDYTRSVKKNKKIQNQAPSELSTESIQGVYKQNNKTNLMQNNIYAEVPEHVTKNQKINDYLSNKPRVTSLPNRMHKMNMLEMNRYEQNNYRPTSLQQEKEPSNVYTSSPLSNPINPLSQINRNNKYEELGSLRKSPFVISDNEVDHICFRKYSGNNDVSEL